MASHRSLLNFGLLLLLLTIVIQSAPIEQSKSSAPLPVFSSTSTPPVPLVNQEKESNDIQATHLATVISKDLSQKEEHDQKTKRQIVDDEFLKMLTDDDSEQSSFEDDDSEHILHAKMKEMAATVHGNAQHPDNIDDSNVFSDIHMNPSELSNIVRRRRDLHLKDQSNRRNKRALSPYDLSDSDEIYDPLAEFLEEDQYVRPDRSFAPIFWYPSFAKRSVRSQVGPYVYDAPSRAPKYPIRFENEYDEESQDEDDDDDDDDDDEDNGYESNRYPILLDTSKNPFDNLQLQQAYNVDDLPIDESENEIFNGQDYSDDDVDQYRFADQNENPYNTRYETFERYF